MKPYQSQNYYELLEISASASMDQIHSAYRRAVALYDPASAAMYALADPAQVQDLRNLLARARDTLSDPWRRAEYHRSLGLPEENLAPAQLSMDELLRAGSAPPRPPPPIERYRATDFLDVYLGAEPADRADTHATQARRDPDESTLNGEAVPVAVTTPSPVRARLKEISPDAEFNGELLRELREAAGLTLPQLSERTRISVRHLENVEADRYDALPATVYLRGMLMNLARELRLDPSRVSRSYLALVAGAQAREK